MNVPSLALLASMASFSASASGATQAEELYFGQTPPGDTPVVFAPGVISLEDRFEQFLLYSPTRASWSSLSRTRAGTLLRSRFFE